jgi:NAD(P)-dependent dehydrogenase (short-subunit alcohol dehydrogenase family)
MLADLSPEVAETAAAEIRAEGGTASAVAVDVADYASVEAMVAETVKLFGGLHIAFNNAGIAGMAPVEHLSPEDWDRILSVNLTGVFHCIKAEAPAMRACGGSAIINTASITSFVASEGMSAYVASKHGVAGLTKAAALDLISDGIRVNAVCPGFTHSSMLDPAKLTPDMAADVKSKTPIGRIASADEVARAVLYLASQDASYVVGALHTVDGGVTLR